MATVTEPSDSNTRTNQQKQLHLRLPQTLFHRVLMFADTRGLSVNAAILVLLHEAFDARDADR